MTEPHGFQPTEAPSVHEMKLEDAYRHYFGAPPPNSAELWDDESSLEQPNPFEFVPSTIEVHRACEPVPTRVR